MGAIPSTYHQCIKFPYEGVEVTIPADLSTTCNALKESVDKLVPNNIESSTKQIDIASTSKMEDIAKEVNIKDNGMGEYTMELVLSLKSLPLSPKSYGQPLHKVKPNAKESQVIFNGSFVLEQVSKQEFEEEEVVLAWLYKDESNSQSV